MIRALFWGLVAAASATSSLSVQAQTRQARATATRPNIIFILADDLGWGDLGCYGNPSIQTPNLDRLARQGTLFTQFYVNGPVCSPSRAAFMTGQFPARNAIHAQLSNHEEDRARGMPDWLDPKAMTVPSLLKQGGYATAHFGKWHLGAGKEAPGPGAYGIDDHRTHGANGPGWQQDKTDPHFRARSTGLIVDEAIRFITANRDRPFYVNVWTLLPHAPLNPTEEQLKVYERFRVSGAPYRSAQQVYYASVTDLDTQLGRLLKHLDELKLADNTLILFASDNGPEDIAINNAGHSGVGSPGPFRGRKRSLYEGGIRVPLLVRWPGMVPAGKAEDSIVSAVDFLPTLCRVAGLRLPGGLELDGEDRSAVLRGQKQERTRPLMWEWRFGIVGHVLNRSPLLAIREGKWKLLMNPDRSRVELYNLSADPSEVDNRADRHPRLVEELAGKVLAWQRTLPKGPVSPGAGRANYSLPKLSH